MAADDRQSKAAELMRKALTAGIGAVFLTEESLRGMVSELKLPKEILGGILESAARTRNEFFQNLSREVIKHVIDRIDPQALVQEILAKNEIQLSVSMNFKPKTEAPPAAGTKPDEPDAT